MVQKVAILLQKVHPSRIHVVYTILRQNGLGSDPRLFPKQMKSERLYFEQRSTTC